MGRLPVILALMFAATLAPAAAQSALPELPARGYVDLSGLLQAVPDTDLIAELRATAERLRNLVGTMPAVAVPEVPPAEPPQIAAGLQRNGIGQDLDPTEVEMELLRAALQAEIDSDRRQALTERARSLQRQLREFVATVRAEWREWEREHALHQRAEVLSLEFLQAREGLGAAAAAHVDRELNLILSVNDEVGDKRRREVSRALTRFARQQAEVVNEEIESTARLQARDLELELARREAELAEQLALQRRYVEERLGELGQLQVELRLDAWRERMPAHTAALEARRARQRAVYLEAARQLEAEAAQMEAGLSGGWTPYLQAVLTVIEARSGAELVTSPAEGVPDVTAAVADYLAALRARPELLTPDPEVAVPTLPEPLVSPQAAPLPR